ncbi:MAG TPA: aminoglycoside adenylyltransferase domain-containing protein [Anaerolineales bacterium]|nr:aminoglycoside adenylyltransferase domain-containing protein [Anaerolineales bacterium]
MVILNASKIAFYQSFIVLSYSRMLHDLQAGSIGSKRTGAEWAQAHLNPSWRDRIDLYMGSAT